MIGSVTVFVRDRRNSYRFTLKRNITILSGDSGRGKTTLYEMIADYNRFRKDSGIKIDCVPNRRVIALGGSDWQDQLERCEDSGRCNQPKRMHRKTKRSNPVAGRSIFLFLLIKGPVRRRY